MIEYYVNKPVKITNHFNYYKDTTIWNGEYNIISGKPTLPIREKCDLSNYTKYLEPTSDYHLKYCNNGLYMLFFCEINVFYVGVAYDNIKDRICKHMVKLFGSNMGSGINHTNESITNETKKGWRFYAKEIFKKYKKENKTYTLDDCFLVTINPKSLKGPLEKSDKKLEFLEKILSDSKHKLINQITNVLTNNKSVLDWQSFNKKERGFEHSYKLINWERKIVENS